MHQQTDRAKGSSCIRMWQPKQTPKLSCRSLDHALAEWERIKSFLYLFHNRWTRVPRYRWFSTHRIPSSQWKSCLFTPLLRHGDGVVPLWKALAVQEGSKLHRQLNLFWKMRDFAGLHCDRSYRASLHSCKRNLPTRIFFTYFSLLCCTASLFSRGSQLLLRSSQCCTLRKRYWVSHPLCSSAPSEWYILPWLQDPSNKYEQSTSLTTSRSRVSCNQEPFQINLQTSIRKKSQLKAHSKLSWNYNRRGCFPM